MPKNYEDHLEAVKEEVTKLYQVGVLVGPLQEKVAALEGELKRPMRELEARKAEEEVHLLQVQRQNQASIWRNPALLTVLVALVLGLVTLAAKGLVDYTTTVRVKNEQIAQLEATLARQDSTTLVGKVQALSRREAQLKATLEAQRAALAEGQEALAQLTKRNEQLEVRSDAIALRTAVFGLINDDLTEYAEGFGGGWFAGALSGYLTEHPAESRQLGFQSPEAIKAYFKRPQIRAVFTRAAVGYYDQLRAHQRQSLQAVEPAWQYLAAE